MWQMPSSHGHSSSFNNETVREGEEGNSAAVSENDSDTEILPSSSASLLFRRKPVVAASLVSQLLSNNSVLQMGPDIQSQRLIGHHRRTRGSSHRYLPCTVTSRDVFIDTSSGHRNNGQDSASENIVQINNEEQSTFPLLIKRSDGNEHSEDLYENNSTPEVDTTVSTDSDESQNDLQMTDHGLLVSSESDEDDNSIESFSPSLIPLGPSYMQSNFTGSDSDSDSAYDNSSTITEVLLQPERELSSIPLMGIDNTPSELHDLNSKGMLDIPRHITKPLLHFDNLLISPQRTDFDLPMVTINAQKLANHLIKLSRYLKTPDLTELCCLNCKFLPLLPITGQCGHTRCMRCIQANGACPCGVSSPEPLFVNTVVTEIMEKMMKYEKKSRIMDLGSFGRTSHDKTCALTGAKTKFLLSRRHVRSSDLIFSTGSSSRSLSRPRLPMTIQDRHHRAQHLVKSGKYLEAASHLVRVAASARPISRPARVLLTKTISASRDEGNVSRKLHQSVREQAAHTWIRPSDLECVLCTSTYSDPVSTPCGHTYCRACIERAMYYNKRCALCLRSLENFNLDETRNNIFISAILQSIGVAPSLVDTDVIPIVTCYVAFPGIPCPLFIFDPRYWLMVRRVLESGSRRFGMLAYDRGHTFADFGTVLEICDCVVLEDSRCIVSTVGVSRFRVIERFDTDGCDVARVQAWTDIPPRPDEARDLRMLAVQIFYKAIDWLKTMDVNVHKEIEAAFGTIPSGDPDAMSNSVDGPTWLWWLIAILPLKSDIQILILSTRSLLKRMLAVSRTLDVMDSDFTPNHASVEIAGREWLPEENRIRFM